MSAVAAAALPAAYVVARLRPSFQPSSNWRSATRTLRRSYVLEALASQGFYYLVLGVVSELHVTGILTTEVSGHCRSVVREIDRARRVAAQRPHLAVRPRVGGDGRVGGCARRGADGQRRGREVRRDRFGRGWIARVNDVRQQAKEMASA